MRFQVSAECCESFSTTYVRGKTIPDSRICRTKTSSTKWMLQWVTDRRLVDADCSAWVVPLNQISQIWGLPVYIALWVWGSTLLLLFSFFVCLVMDFCPEEQLIGMKFCTVISHNVPCVIFHFWGDTPSDLHLPDQKEASGRVLGGLETHLTAAVVPNGKSCHLHIYISIRTWDQLKRSWPKCEVQGSSPQGHSCKAK